MTFFRVRWSPAGVGHAAYIFMDPHLRYGGENICLTDNIRLSRYLTENFVAYFGAFNKVAAFEELQYEEARGFRHDGDGLTRWSESAQRATGEMHLEWTDLGEPYRAVIPPDRSPTGHQITATYIEAGTGSIRLNGEEARGRPASRDFHGRDASTCFLAFSETWSTLHNDREATQ